MAPEHPFPAACQDAIAAAEFVAANLDSFGGSTVLGVAGDSAGGNLYAIVAAEVPGIAAQLLIYPAVAMLGSYASRTPNAEGYFLQDRKSVESGTRWSGRVNPGGHRIIKK